MLVEKIVYRKLYCDKPDATGTSLAFEKRVYILKELMKILQKPFEFVNIFTKVNIANAVNIIILNTDSSSYILLTVTELLSRYH